MRSIPDSQAIALIAIMSLLTFFVRGLPFLLFSGKSKTPAYIMYLGKVLPYAIIGMLVVYCFKNVSLLQTPFGLPELIAASPSFWYTAGRKTRFSPLEEGHCFTCFLFR